MDKLPLAPSLSEAIRETRSFRSMFNEGFIDEQVVSRVIARGAYNRISTQPEGIALSSSREDYAGWDLPIVSDFLV